MHKMHVKCYYLPPPPIPNFQKLFFSKTHSSLIKNAKLVTFERYLGEESQI